MTEHIIIGNDHEKIKTTNYWETNYNKEGYIYVSLNAGAMRLLLPENLNPDIEAMKNTKTIVISKGKHVEYDREMFEVLFDDNSDYPYVLFLSLEQFDRQLNIEYR